MQNPVGLGTQEKTTDREAILLGIWEIERGEFLVQSAGGGVIRECGGDFVFEVAEMIGFVITPYRGGPLFTFFVPVDAFVFGCSVRASSLVLAVLGEGCKAEVFLLVVQAIVVDVVN